MQHAISGSTLPLRIVGMLHTTCLKHLGALAIFNNSVREMSADVLVGGFATAVFPQVIAATGQN
jgi:hypothetical protein